MPARYNKLDMKQYKIETPNGNHIIDSKYPMEETIIKFIDNEFHKINQVRQFTLILDQTNTDTSCIIYYQMRNPTNRFKISLYP